MVTNLLRPSTTTLRERDFDAKEALLVARGTTSSPTALWSTTALLMTLERVVTTMPYTTGGTFALKREVDGTSAFAFLGQRGVDPAKLLQHGFGKVLILNIDARLAVAELKGSIPAGAGNFFHDWQRLRRGAFEGQTPVGRELRMSMVFREHLASWLADSSIEDVLRWTPPAELLGGVERQSDASEKEFLWFVERFTKTYLSDWSDESLALEYKYVLEQWRPRHLPSELLMERDIKSEKICQEISGRAVHGKKTDPFALAVLVERALEAIDEERRDVAAAIFTAARTIEPNDPSLANNLGFCLIPDDPVKALEILTEARSLGQESILNFANTVAAHVVLGDLESALRICDEARAFGLRNTQVAWLWRLPLEGEPQVSEVGPASYICDLAILAASTLGNETLADSWRTRQGYLHDVIDRTGS